MTLMPVASQYVLQGCLVHEQFDAYRPRKFLDAQKSLIEEEIHALRRHLEQVALAEKSFTSEIVVQLSMKLDDKINEYHHLVKNKLKS